MSTDSIISVYADTRMEYTKQLCIFLVPAFFQSMVDLFAKAKQGNEPKKVLWQFQTMLNEIHEWNMEKVHNEISRIQMNTGCDYLDDLLTAVFIAHTKVLTAIRLSANHNKIDITVPKVEHFLFKVLCEVSKLLWSSTYLFREDISGMERQKNYKQIEGIINEGIIQAIRSLVPVKTILKNLVSHTDTVKTEQKDHDSDDDICIKRIPSDPNDTIPKPMVSMMEPSIVEPSIAKPPIVEPPIVEPPIVEPPIVEPLILEPTIAKPPIAKPPIAKPPIAKPPIAKPTVINQIINPDEEDEDLDDEPQIDVGGGPVINLDELDEKPTVSFAEYNSMFSSEDPQKTSMISSGGSPDLEILDQHGSALSADDFDSMDEPSSALSADDFEVL